MSEESARRSFLNLLAERYKLTASEIRICELIFNNTVSSKAIAQVMKISVATVNTHRRNLRKKLKLNKNDFIEHFLNAVYLKNK